MIEILMKILSNKYTWIVLILLSIFIYYTLTVKHLNYDLANMTLERDKITQKYSIVKNNLKVCVETNENNSKEVKKFKDKVQNLKELNEILSQGKNKEIASLKKIIANMKVPVIYPSAMHFKDITLKIKTKEEMNENDTTFNIINSIGF